MTTTGWPPPPLAQDDHPGLFRWLASRIDSRRLAREHSARVRKEHHTMSEFEQFFQGYISCAVWSNPDTNGSRAALVFATETTDAMRRDCHSFFTDHVILLAKHFGEDKQYPWAYAGHDFWLTRNSHGAGFWDRGLGGDGDTLTRAAKAYSSVDLYVGDDGYVYA